MNPIGPDDHRLKVIREVIHIHGGWCTDVERAVVDALGSAYESGVASVAIGRCRYRVIDWIAGHEGERGHTHDDIARHIQSRRETVTRHISRLRMDGLVSVKHLPGTRGDRTYGLTVPGRLFASEVAEHMRGPL